MAEARSCTCTPCSAGSSPTPAGQALGHGAYSAPKSAMWSATNSLRLALADNRALYVKQALSGPIEDLYPQLARVRTN